mmetsp:Transcript_129769/g.323401  ORF Transcript_129769/g.323401 Transcript_129769/m.323401 type:complete len:499 (-) Transcript_129769:614-2110(-)
MHLRELQGMLIPDVAQRILEFGLSFGHPLALLLGVCPGSLQSILNLAELLLPDLLELAAPAFRLVPVILHFLPQSRELRISERQGLGVVLACVGQLLRMGPLQLGRGRGVLRLDLGQLVPHSRQLLPHGHQVAFGFRTPLPPDLLGLGALEVGLVSDELHLLLRPVDLRVLLRQGLRVLPAQAGELVGVRPLHVGHVALRLRALPLRGLARDLRVLPRRVDLRVSLRQGLRVCPLQPCDLLGMGLPQVGLLPLTICHGLAGLFTLERNLVVLRVQVAGDLHQHVTPSVGFRPRAIRLLAVLEHPPLQLFDLRVPLLQELVVLGVASTELLTACVQHGIVHHRLTICTLALSSQVSSHSLQLLLRLCELVLPLLCSQIDLAADLVLCALDLEAGHADLVVPAPQGLAVQRLEAPELAGVRLLHLLFRPLVLRERIGDCPLTLVAALSPMGVELAVGLAEPPLPELLNLGDRLSSGRLSVGWSCAAVLLVLLLLLLPVAL